MARTSEGSPFVKDLDAGGELHLPLLTEDNARRMRAGMVTLAPGEECGRHSTEDYEELLIILEGGGEAEMEGYGALALEAGQVAYIGYGRVRRDATAAGGYNVEGFGWALLAGLTLIPLAIFGAMSIVGVGLDAVVPDSPFRIAEEYVEIELAPGSVRVSAMYAFENDTGRDETLALTYPFGEGRGVGAAENVALFDGAGKEIPFAWKGNKVTFDVSVPRKNYAQVVVSYEQPLGGTAFTYLLGKDRFWGLPGADTTFVVTAPAALGNVSSVYSLKKVADEEGGSVRYEYSRKRFYPQNNFTLTWENAAAAAP